MRLTRRSRGDQHDDSWPGWPEPRPMSPAEREAAIQALVDGATGESHPVRSDGWTYRAEVTGVRAKPGAADQHSPPGAMQLKPSGITADFPEASPFAAGASRQAGRARGRGPSGGAARDQGASRGR